MMGVLLCLLPTPLPAQPSTTGQTGLINMPDGRIDPEGTLRFGLSYNKPYTALWSSITFLPRLELSARYTNINDAPAFQGDENADFGDYKDKAFDAKLLLLRESRWLPAISAGTQDYMGTRLFAAHYMAMSKRLFGDLDVTLGYGTKRIDGLFGGVRYNPSWHRKLELLLEYDAYGYGQDLLAAESGALGKRGGATFGVGYRMGWFGIQAAYGGGDVGGNLSVSIPLNRKEFIPKIDEPAPFRVRRGQQPAAAWRENSRLAAALRSDLEMQGYKNVHIVLAGGTVRASLTHPRIFLMGRAVGRAARTILLAGPADAQAIEIIYTRNDLPLATYVFSDPAQLRAYFDGEISAERLSRSVTITRAVPAAMKAGTERAVSAMDPERGKPATALETAEDNEGHLLGFKWEDRRLSRLHVVPFNVRLFVNDPSGAFHYDIYSLAQYRKHFGRGFFLDSGVRFTLLEDVSKVRQGSNSRLPHVRSDIALYLQGGRLNMDRLLLNKYTLLGERLFSRVSAGYYEEMFAGVGGQVLYLPREGHWAVDVSVDWLRQRSPDEYLGFRDYSVLTALGAFHYRLPAMGLTATARAGRFLARDKGVRLELKRRFRSGVELGAWYTVTDGEDTTPPGAPGDPYYDKGIYMLVYLNALLTRDTQAFAAMSIAPWTRDVGQMVVSPGDLYNLVERPLMLDDSETGLMTDFGK